ncbi:hypothetical protein C8258_00365 [Nocardia sp. MDA0666]|uniref:hypothetical protein n=1 Tax=Nocardia sp. MDA0666 TaxID=2135448 RepID=UPI000D13EABE|nr:hypothetical protein [Nocardia sp. MDA0666]PSR69596.1 hypothetical protein C8258_00365 [Nocardia sp. MDA0666]
MSDFDSTGPTPRLTAALCRAAQLLGDEVRAVLLHSPRPVFLFYLAQTFDQLEAELSSGRPPGPATPAQQLCLHLMLAHVEAQVPAEDLVRARRRLLRHDTGDNLAEVRAIAGNSGGSYDFIALGDVLAAGGMGAFFAPFEPSDLAA